MRTFSGFKKNYTHFNFRCSCSKLNIVKCKGIVCIGQAHWILEGERQKNKALILDEAHSINAQGMEEEIQLLLTLFVNWLVRFCIVFTMWIFMKCIALERHCLNLAK